jgi:hypothetical protein
MADISRQIAYLYPGITFGPGRDCLIDGDADAIAEWRHPSPQPTPAQLAAAELPAAKAASIAANRAECSRRIFARYPAGRQLSALAGLYDSANVATMTDWIASNISAENTAADAIEAATTVQAVEAVSVSWPA